MDKDQKTILALETAIGNGSLAMLRGSTVVRSRSGGASRAEDLLISIDGILDESQLRLADVDIIAVSVGPGSYTGIRIGLSTVLGLKRATKAEVVGISALEALASFAKLADRIAAVPIGRGRIAAQRFRVSERGSEDPQVVSAENLFEEIRSQPDRKYILRSEIVENAESGMNFQDLDNVIVANGDLAVLIGELAAAGQECGLEPFYL